MQMKMKYRRMTTDDIDTLRRDFAAYVPITEIARKLGRSPGVIRQKVLHLGLRRSGQVTRALRYASPELRDHRPEMTDAEFVTAAKEWRRGTNARRRAARNEKVHSAMAAIGAGDGSRNIKMRSMRDAGATLEEIGQYFGISRERVRQVVELELRPPKPNGKAPPIKTILRLWNGMMPSHKAAFLAEIGAEIKPSLPPLEWTWMELM